MFLSKNDYDRGVNTFSPEGRLFQVEYAIEAIKLGSTAIGIKTTAGVVLCVEKRITSSLMVPSSVHKCMEIDKHVGCAMSGLTADARTMIDYARIEAQNHWFTYNENVSVESITQSICDLALRFGEANEKHQKKIMSRPFGVSLLIGGVDAEGIHLFHTDPTGTFFEYKAKAIGSGSEAAQAALKTGYHEALTIEEAETLGLSILKQVMEEPVTDTNVEVCSVTNELGFCIYPKEKVHEIIKTIKD